MVITAEMHPVVEEMPRLPAQRLGDQGRIVVGVDGCPASVAALRWALRLAERRDWTVEVVAAWPDPAEAFVREAPGHFNVPRNRTVSRVHEAVAASTGGTGSARITLFVENMHPVEALLERACGASLLVLGDTRWGSTRPGGVASACARLAPCPVALVTTPERDLGPSW